MNPSSSRIVLGVIYFLTCFTIFGSLFLAFSLFSTKHISPCDWSCQLDYKGLQTSCGSELPFCPEQTLEQCVNYVDNPSSYSDDFKKECTLLMVGRNSSYILSLPFYGFFINGILLDGINFQTMSDRNNFVRSEEQNVSVTFGHSNHTFSVGDRSVSLNSSGFNYNPELVFQFGEYSEGYSSLLFIESISLMGNGILVFIAATVFMVIAFAISTLLFCCCVKCLTENPRTLDSQPLIN